MIVLLHSSGASPRQWSALAERLRARVRVATPRLVGHDGHASWAHGVDPGLEGEVDALCAQVRTDGPVHLVGHSYGAAVAIKAALSGRMDVRSLAVYEPSMFALLGERMARYASAESPARVAREVGDAVALGREDEAALAYVDYWSGAGTHAALSPESRARIGARMHTVCACFEALFGDATRLCDLHRLDFPCLVMSGNRSPRPSQDICELVAANLAGARHHRFSGLDHMGPVSAGPAVFPVIEEFLAAMTRRWEAAPRAA